jgi:16S rRNA (guanine966-N2)-methyltransferase
VARTTAGAFLARPATAPGFDLVLADPPYDLPAPGLTEVLDALALPARLRSGAVVALERPRRSAGALPTGWVVEFERVYGDTLLTVAAPIGRTA